MSKFSIFLAFIFGMPSLMAHEGHNHGEGAKTTIMTLVLTGSEGHQFLRNASWGNLTHGEVMGELHGDLTLDKVGNLYVSMNDEPGIYVFDRFGQFQRSLKKGLAGMHSLSTVTEGDQQFIWGAQLPRNRAVKFDLEGNVLATLPNEKTGELDGGLEGLTEVLVAPDGHLFFFMGYGSQKIHKLKADGTLVKSYGEEGEGRGQFQGCHGAAIDLRYDEPRILLCDRDGRRMVHLTMDLTWIGVYGESQMRRPADVDVRGDYAAVAEFEGRVILMDKEGKMVSALCDNPNQKQWASHEVPASELKDDAFAAPHGIKWSEEGRIFVSEYSKVGRIIALFPKK